VADKLAKRVWAGKADAARSCADEAIQVARRGVTGPEVRPLLDTVNGCLVMLEGTLGPEVVTAELDAGAVLPVNEAITRALAELRVACLM
jgi:hypothetical protein